MRNYTPRPKTGLPQKKPKTPLKRTRIKPKKVEPQHNLLILFQRMWLSRISGQNFVSVKHEFKDMEEWLHWVQQYRVCAVTYKPIRAFNVWNYAHVLARQFKRFREQDFNILMMSERAHTLYDTGSREKFLEHGPGAKFVLEYHDHLKAKYYERGNNVLQKSNVQ